jgi:hypothetical protein
MKVEFAIDEVIVMANAVIDDILAAQKFSRQDGAALRRWRSDAVATTSRDMQRLTEKMNAELQRAHDNSLKSGIAKPDWA